MDEIAGAAVDDSFFFHVVHLNRHQTDLIKITRKINWKWMTRRFHHQFYCIWCVSFSISMSRTVFYSFFFILLNRKWYCWNVNWLQMTENGKVNKSFSIDTENRFLFVTAISQIVFYIYFFVFIFTSIDGIQSMNQNQNFSISFSFTVLWPFKKNVVRELNKSNAL